MLHGVIIHASKEATALAQGKPPAQLATLAPDIPAGSSMPSVIKVMEAASNHKCKNKRVKVHAAPMDTIQEEKCQPKMEAAPPRTGGKEEVIQDSEDSQEDDGEALYVANKGASTNASGHQPDIDASKQYKEEQASWEQEGYAWALKQLG